MVLGTYFLSLYYKRTSARFYFFARLHDSTAEHLSNIHTPYDKTFSLHKQVLPVDGKFKNQERTSNFFASVHFINDCKHSRRLRPECIHENTTTLTRRVIICEGNGNKPATTTDS
jgi:hypothetical protein